MNSYEELAGHRFSPGRDYDKRSVETFRARVLNLMDELLNQVTQLQDEVADLRERSRAVPLEPEPSSVMVTPVVPTSWLEALAGTAVLPPPGSEPVAATASTTALGVGPYDFPAPSVASWLAELEIAADTGVGDTEADDDDDDGAGSTAELLLAAAGNAVAVQAAAAATRHDEPNEPNDPDDPHEPATPRAPLAEVVPLAVVLPLTGVVQLTDVVPPAVRPPVGSGTVGMVVTPGNVVVTTPRAPITDPTLLPIVLDDSLPDDGPLPAPVRHWAGWTRHVAGV